MIGSKVSKRYAKALLTIGQEDGKFMEYGKELGEFSSICRVNEEFFQILASRIFGLEERKVILQGVLRKSAFSGTTKDFLSLLLEKNRIGAVHQITSWYDRLTDEISNVARAEVITARPLKEDARGRLEKALQQLTSKNIRMETKVDQGLVGGIVVKIGDLILDGSVKAQLSGLKESLKRGG